jgi:hypothetical protein
MSERNFSEPASGFGCCPLCVLPFVWKSPITMEDSFELSDRTVNTPCLLCCSVLSSSSTRTQDLIKCCFCCALAQALYYEKLNSMRAFTCALCCCVSSYTKVEVKDQYGLCGGTCCTAGCALATENIKACECFVCAHGAGCGKYKKDENYNWFCQLFGCCMGYGLKQ